MKQMLAFLRSMLSDPLFHRVCVAVFSIPFAALGLYVALLWHPADMPEWLGFALILSVGSWGLFLFYAATIGSDTFFNRASRFAETDADILGALFVVVVGLIALPITLLLRKVKGRTTP